MNNFEKRWYISNHLSREIAKQAQKDGLIDKIYEALTK